MANVFISYKKEERDRAGLISVALEQLLVTTWLDAQLSPGKSFTEEIREELDRCDAQIVCWSRSAMTSEWVRGEAEIGRQRSILIPVFIEKCDLLPPFNMLHAEDLSQWTGDPNHPGWQSVLRRLGLLLNRTGLAELPRLIASSDPVAWRAWSLRFPSDPAVSLAPLEIASDVSPTITQEATAQRRTRPATTIQELRAASEAADFRLRVFRDAAKKFGWRDAEEEKRLELEVDALKKALADQQKEQAAQPKPPRIPIRARVGALFRARTLPEKIGIVAAGTAFAFGAGFFLIWLLVLSIRPTDQTVRNDPATSPAGDTISPPEPFDVQLLGPLTDNASFRGEFEAVGADPSWSLQFSDDHASLQFQDGASHEAFVGTREIRAGGAQVVYSVGGPLAIVILQRQCSLPSGVQTAFTTYVRTNLTTYEGCAREAQSEVWPPWRNEGSQFWRFEPHAYEDDM